MSNNTLAAIKSRCDEYGDCWIWRGTLSKGYPVMRINGRGTYQLVRRIAYLASGKSLKQKARVTSRCRERKCVNPACLKSSNASEIAKEAVAIGTMCTFATCAKIAATLRKRSKTTMEVVADIVGSDETYEALAKRHGISRSMAGKIKRRQSWKDYSSPWAGLVA